MAASAALSPASVPVPADPPTDTWRMVAFLCMVFGMFMAILDIQIVSASLNEIQAGLSASGDEIPWVQTSVSAVTVPRAIRSRNCASP